MVINTVLFMSSFYGYFSYVASCPTHPQGYTIRVKYNTDQRPRTCMGITDSYFLRAILSTSHVHLFISLFNILIYYLGVHIVAFTISILKIILSDRPEDTLMMISEIKKSVIQFPPLQFRICHSKLVPLHAIRSTW